MTRIISVFTVLLQMSCCPCSRLAVDSAAQATGPLELAFRPADDNASPLCGVPAGRTQAYDPQTGIYHVHFKTQDFRQSVFEITKVAEHYPKPVVFHLTGDTKGAGCLGQDLTLTVDGKDYAIEKSELACGNYDATMFRVERNSDAVNVEFTTKGAALLKPGARIWLRVDTGW